jgi:hypothetical protein
VEGSRHGKPGETKETTTLGACGKLGGLVVFLIISCAFPRILLLSKSVLASRRGEDQVNCRSGCERSVHVRPPGIASVMPVMEMLSRDADTMRASQDEISKLTSNAQ